jgi:hypothetical protein
MIHLKQIQSGINIRQLSGFHISESRLDDIIVKSLKEVRTLTKNNRIYKFDCSVPFNECFTRNMFKSIYPCYFVVGPNTHVVSAIGFFKFLKFYVISRIKTQGICI